MADNLLDKASILLTPTAYNDGSMLSIKPENGDGDFDFSRSSAATRVNAQGLVENVQIISSELVSNGDFSQIGTEEVLNGNFSQEGSEQISNGSFDTDTKWTTNTGWSISGGSANCDGTQSGNTTLVQQNGIKGAIIDFVVGKTYKVNFDIVVTSGVITQLEVASGVDGNDITTSGNYTTYITAVSTNDRFTITANSDFIGSIDNVSVKEVGQNWSFGTGWGMGDGKAVKESGVSSYLLQSMILPTPNTYKVTFTVSDYVSGDVKWGFTSTTASIFGTPRTSNGTYTEYFSHDSDTIALRFRASSDFEGSITNISVKEVGQDWTFGTGWSIGDSSLNAIGAGDYAKQTNVSAQNTNAILKVQWTQDITSGTRLRFFPRNYNDSATETVLSGSATDGGVYNNTNCTGSGTYTIYVSVTDGFSFKLLAESGNNATITNVSVKEVTDDTDLPRIDYTDGCGNWLLEPQSTNLIPYSEDFSLWANGTTYTTQNYSVSPSGEQNASRCLFTGANQNIQLSFSNSAETTASIYVKGVSGETIRFGTSFQENNFTLDGTWQRLSITRSVSPYSFAISISTYGGATARDIEIWGAQVENLSYATSYIPTNGATSTRLQDLATNSGNASLINSTEGVLYCEAATLVDPTGIMVIGLSDGTLANRISITFHSTLNRIQVYSQKNSSQLFNIDTTSVSKTNFNKVAISYSSTSAKLFVNGTLVASATPSDMFAANTLDRVNFDVGNGSLNFYGKTKALAVYKEALTDAELQSLTTI